MSNILNSIAADRLSKINESPTLALTKLISQLKSQGQKIIDFGVGEPSFETPDHVNKAAIDAIHQGKTKYTPVDGTASLKKAIVHKFKEDNNLDYETTQITVGCGAKQIIFNAMMGTLNPGDEVIIPAPYWVSYPDMVQVAEGTPVIIECGQSSNFKMTAEQLEAAITPKTKWVFLNSPSNPTGMIYEKSELDAIAKVLMKHEQIWLMSDDIYEHLVYDNKKFYTMLNIEPKLRKRTFIVNGVSKSHSMTGWRIGFGAGPEELIKNIAKIQSHSTSNPCSISQYAAEEALKHDMIFFNKWKSEYIKRRNLAFEILSQSEYLDIIKPNGAFYIFVNCTKAMNKKTKDGDLIKNDQDLCKYLLHNAKVGVVPGSAFGLPNYFRMSYVSNEETVKNGCCQIINALNELSK
jgi:aspartate aminotransferase